MTRLVELMFEAAKWNEENLPHNTIEMQLSKVTEELLELNDAISIPDNEDKARAELADVFISMSGIARFDFFWCIEYIRYLYTYIEGLSEEYIASAVEDKLKILKTRKYQIVDGVYRHVELH